MNKIDLHVHCLPSSFKKALLDNNLTHPDGFPTPDWSAKDHLEMMKRLKIDFSMLSISSPYICLGDDNYNKILARKVNNECFNIVKEHPNKFGFIASLPLLNTQDSIEEINYVFNDLNADGVMFPTNIDGVYLGNPKLDSIFEELNRHNAIVLIHPTTPSTLPEDVNENLPIPLMEFFFDTTRAITNMMLKGTLNKFPNIKFIIPHAGAFLPLLADRLDSYRDVMKMRGDTYVPNFFSDLKKFYYDLAGFCIPRQLEVLLQVADKDHLLYGSDYPYTPEFKCSALQEMLNNTTLINNEDREKIYFKNAFNLFPRLSKI